MKSLLILIFLFISLGALSSEGGFRPLFKGIRGRSSIHPRDIYIYLPPNFSNSHKIKYPVLYMHDGQNLFDPSRATFGFTWEMEKTLDDLIKAKRIPPIIVVGIDNTPDRTSEYTHAWDEERSTGGQAREYLDFIVYDLKRYIDHVYPTKKEREFTGIMGSSLGGLVSLYAGAQFPDVFGLIGAMSPSVWWDNKSILSMVDQSDLPIKVYLDSGMLNGERPADALEVYDVYKKNNLEELLLIIDPLGEHNEKSWARRLPKALTFLYEDT